MRTNIDIDDDLLAEAMKAAGLTTKKATVEEALRRLVKSSGSGGQSRIRRVSAGSGDLHAMRQGRPGRAGS